MRSGRGILIYSAGQGLRVKYSTTLCGDIKVLDLSEEKVD